MLSDLKRALLASLMMVVVPSVMDSQTAPQTKSVLFAAVGAELTQYDLDLNSATLTRRSSVTLPANVQEAWQSPSRKYLYVAWSNGGASYSSIGGVVPKNDRHGVSAFRIDPASGALLPHGQPVSLPSRPVFITTDIDGTHVITAHNDPSGLVVHRILSDGTLGAEVPPAGPLDFGIFGHQVRVDPSNKTVILVTRGNGPTASKPEDPGALKIFSYNNGVLGNKLSIAPNGGFGYQVRHLDFHPSGKWAFVTLERQNQIHVYRRMPDGTLSPRPLFVKDTLANRAIPGANQSAASIHVHPNGKFVYVTNRASSMVDFQGKQVFAGGENSIAVFAINQQTGEPTLIENIDSQGFEPRTFSLNSSGTVLAVANQLPLSVPANIALFRVGADGRLEFARKYDMETGPGRSLFWAKIIALP
jgi:6-phosphogluconolactonase (cycloisomerase 2 family)